MYLDIKVPFKAFSEKSVNLDIFEKFMVREKRNEYP